ncbi:reverse transcriptase domain-containing protein [Tanacetum coccineum]
MGTKTHNGVHDRSLKKLKIDRVFPSEAEKNAGKLPERTKAILEEVHKLVEAGIMREVYYHDWLSNPVMVKKSDGSWRMGITKSKAKDDEEKTAFHTSQGVYCYTKMPFGLKNAGATYQRLVDNAFEGQVGRNLEVYVDDLVIKSHTEDELKDVPRIIDKGYGRHQDVSRTRQKRYPTSFTAHDERSPVVKWEVSRFEQIPIQVSRQVTPLVQNTQEVCEEGRLPLDYGSRRSFHAAQAAYSSTSHASRTPTRGGVISYALKDTEINIAQMEKLIHVASIAAKRIASGYGGFSIEKPETDIVLPQSEVNLPEPWILFTDGSSCVDGSGAGLILTNPEGMEFTYALRFEFTATNNEAEYEALLAGLRIAARMGVRNLEANVDSRLVANHVLGEYVAKEDNMVQYLDKEPRSLFQGVIGSPFGKFLEIWVTNRKADDLVRSHPQASRPIKAGIGSEILKNKSISEMEISTVVEEQDPTWMTPIVEFINTGTLPQEQKDARRIRRRLRAASSMGFMAAMQSGPTFCGGESLTVWDTSGTMQPGDARDMIKKCKDCQVHRPIPRQPQQELAPITSPWPFHKWGIDIAGPFPAAAGGLKFLIVAIDYFTKWIEAKAVATITGNQVKRFVWDNIVCRFGLPGEIVSDNGKQFYQGFGMSEQIEFSEQESSALVDTKQRGWRSLSHVLWAHRTTIKVSTGDTPFSLVYGTEAVIPAEIGMPTIRTAEVNITTNDDERHASHAEDTDSGPKWEGPYAVTEALEKVHKAARQDGR